MAEKKIRMATSENSEDQGHTIVGGRPQANKSQRNDIPRGLEILIKKAAIDAGFKQELIQRREKLVDELKIPLDASERAMLNCVSADHLEKMIDATEVPPAQQKVLSGASTAAMLALLAQLTFSPYLAGAETGPTGTNQQGFKAPPPPEVSESASHNGLGGIRPDRPDDHYADRGARPDLPDDFIQTEPEKANLAAEPFARTVTIDVTGKSVSAALNSIAENARISIDFSGLDSASSEFPVSSHVEGLEVTEALQAICSEAANKVFSFSISYDSSASRVNITFKSLTEIKPEQNNNQKPGNSSAICRGIRSDLPDLLKKSPGSDNGDIK